MTMYRKIRFLLILSLLAVFSQVKAQFNDPMTMEVGPHVGASFYMGDLNPMYPFAQSKLQYGGIVRFNYDNRWTFRFDYARATVMASDEVIKWRPERNLNFTSTINDFSLTAEFNFLEYYTGNPKKNVSPYIFGGISVFHYTTYAIVGDTLLNLRGYDTEAPLDSNAKWYDRMFGKSSPVCVSIPFGFGVKFSLSRHMAATVEWRMQKTFTDYLDDVGTVYAYSNRLTESEFNQLENKILYKEKHIVMENGAVNRDDSYVLWYNLADPSDGPLRLQVDDYGNEIKQIETIDNKQYIVVPGNYLPGQQRGNSSFNDWFGMARVSLTWKFNLPDSRGCNLSKF